MVRKRLAPVVASLLLHFGAVTLLLAQPLPVAHVMPGDPPIEWVIVEVPPLVEVPLPPALPPATQEPTARQPKSTVEPERPPLRAPEPSGPLASDPPRLEPSPTLFPQPSLYPSGAIAEAPRGQTLRPDDSQFLPEVIRAAEEQRVKQRVDGWAGDQLAEARAQRGLPHPYFFSVRDAARTGLSRRAREAGLTATTTQTLTAIGKRYAESASSYAKTGNPDLGPPGINPRLSERLQERFGNEPEAMALRALAQATETQHDLSHGKPLLVMTLELRQYRDGSPLTVALIRSSSDSKFDAFVLEAWPKSIAEVGPPPADAFHSPELRSTWVIEGWPELSKKLQSATSYLPMPGVMGMSAERILPALTDEGYHYEFQARMLRLYQ